MSGGSVGHQKRVSFDTGWSRCWAPKTGEFSTRGGHGAGHRKRVVFHKGWSNGWCFALSDGGLGQRKTNDFSHGGGRERRKVRTKGGDGATPRKWVGLNKGWVLCWVPETCSYNGVATMQGTENGGASTHGGAGAGHRKWVGLSEGRCRCWGPKRVNEGKQVPG